MKNTICMNCGCKNLIQFLDLGEQPNGNHFPTYDELDNEPRFSFAMDVCIDCWQVQIEEFPPPEYMFSNHPYLTGLNKPVLDHFMKISASISNKFIFPKSPLVIDIGANDGSLLSMFRDLGFRVLGIDPGKLSGSVAKENNITICETFWNEEASLAIKALNVKPDLITATAVFYHVEDLHSFIRGLCHVMSEDTVFMAQCVYMKDIIEKLQFDHFYHEHTMIHSIGPLKRIFEKYSLKIIDVELYPVHGGSFVVYVSKINSKHVQSENVDKLLKSEYEFGLNQIDTYYQFGKNVKKNSIALKNILKKITEKGKIIYALGAPLKGSTLLNYCDIGPDLVQKAVEVNPFKIGKFTPGTHIPIVYEQEIDKQPDYYLVLTWNFLDYFLEKYKTFIENGGAFIVPHPKVQIIDRNSRLIKKS
jgi:hypothetical protein